MNRHTIYVVVMALAIVSMAVVLNALPRSTYSELERRELKTLPSFTLDSLFSGDFTKEMSSWYSDTEPFREVFMEFSMKLRKMSALEVGKAEEQITFIAPDAEMEVDTEELAELYAEEEGTIETELEAEKELREEKPLGADSEPTKDQIKEQNGKIANHGILIVGKEPTARALMVYHGKNGGEGYAKVVNTYKEKFGGDVNIYCMIIPTAIEFYCPEKARSSANSEQATIDNLHAHLLPTVHQVNLIPALRPHVDEEIYLRTDHHWAPRAAYYAARELAREAGVPFMDMSTYDEHVTHRFVGTMYGFSKDVSIKNSPEDFYYWTPNGVDYTVTYTVYNIDENYRVTGEQKPYSSDKFFFHFRDGSGSAYCTFMGGDTKLTKVVTSTKNGRRLIILKDSFGNALPGWLFGSFEEIHVIDGRYFTKNMVEYVRNNNITDIVFCNNVFKAYAGGKQYLRFLEQSGSSYYVPSKPDEVVDLSIQTEATDSASNMVTDSVKAVAAEPHLQTDTVPSTVTDSIK